MKRTWILLLFVVGDVPPQKGQYVQLSCARGFDVDHPAVSINDEHARGPVPGEYSLRVTGRVEEEAQSWEGALSSLPLGWRLLHDNRCSKGWVLRHHRVDGSE